jgi:hypothetical protein
MIGELPDDDLIGYVHFWAPARFPMEYLERLSRDELLALFLSACLHLSKSCAQTHAGPDVFAFVVMGSDERHSLT